MIVVDVSRCAGCHSCELACAVEHSTAKTLVKALAERPRPRRRVEVEAAGAHGVPLQCRQCEDAPCIAVCPSAALHRADQDSPIVIRRNLCIGCTWCVIACPFGVIRLDEESRAIIKCDQCFERVARGERPACVAACPTGALKYESLSEHVGKKRRAALVRIVRALEEDEEA